MARPKTERARIDAKLTPRSKKQLGEKLIATGFVYLRAGTIEPGFSEFMEVLASKPLDWFEKNFKKGIDTSE